MTLDSLGLTEAQKACLEQGPFDVFTMVAAADAVPDSREWSAFRQAVRSAVGHEDGIVQATMAVAATKLDERPTTAGDTEAALSRLQQLRSVADSLPGTALIYRRTLLEMGKAIAEASGAQPTRSFAIGGGDDKWHTSSGTSAMERESIERVAEALGLS